MDINDQAIILSNSNLDFQVNNNSKTITKIGDAQNLNFIKNASIDLICTHPPYTDIIKYSNDIFGDISFLTYDGFLIAMEKFAMESYRILKPGKICCFMMGDIRKHGNVIPLAFET